MKEKIDKKIRFEKDKLRSAWELAMEAARGEGILVDHFIELGRRLGSSPRPSPKRKIEEKLQEGSQEYTRITLRIPKEVHKLLQEEASTKSHSMNAEIIQRIEKSFIYEEYNKDDTVNFCIDEGDVESIKMEVSRKYLEQAEKSHQELMKDEKASDIEKAISFYELRKERRRFHSYLKEAEHRGVEIDPSILTNRSIEA